MTKEERLANANELIKLIAELGRKFFNYNNYVEKNGTISHFKLKNNRIYFVDGYTKKEMYAYDNNHRLFKRYFSEGGTLEALVLDLSEYIRTGKPANSKHGYGGVYCPHWGYPDKDMDKIREKAVAIGFSKSRSDDYKNHSYIYS